MMRVKASLKVSAIHGIGLFADADIPAGAVVWDFDPPFDLAFDRSNLDAFPDFVKAEILKFSFWDARLKKFVLCADNARFFNHAEEAANCVDHEDKRRTVALRDIARGEELTANYREWALPSGELFY
jgi:SET domain-containing protein